MTHVKNIRVFVRGLRGYPIEQQQDACQRIIAATKIQSVEYTDKERAAWIKSIRKDEVAMVARLDVIATRKTESKRRPVVDFTTTVAEIITRCAYIVEAETGITSDDAKQWPKRVEWATQRISQGRELSPREAARMSRKRWAKAEPGVVERWLSPEMVKTHKRWQQHWRDVASYANDREAFEAMPDELQQEFGSPTTARRIFGKRRPKDNSAGGRPPKSKR